MVFVLIKQHNALGGFKMKTQLTISFVKNGEETTTVTQKMFSSQVKPFDISNEIRLLGKKVTVEGILVELVEA